MSAGPRIEPPTFPPAAHLLNAIPDGRRSPYLLEVNAISKSFPGVRALDNVSFALKPGTVHALMGENGAGKSTLMKIISGLYSPDAGALHLHGRVLRLDSPRQALAAGIAMIHQELNLLPFMTAAENIWIGREPLNCLGLVSHKRLRLQTLELFRQLRIDIDPDAPVVALPIASRQMLEIAKAISFESELLIMDEPTSALTATEAAHLFEIIRMLKARGTGIIYITHKLDEVCEIADEISILRDGRHIATGPAPQFTRERIIQLMVGREISQLFPKQTTAAGPIILSARELTLRNHFHHVSFDLRAGEILGVAGLTGSGRSKLAEVLFGLSAPTSGQLWVDGRIVTIDSPRAAMSLGLAFLTEDRKETGCFLSLDILDNLQVSILTRDFARLGFVRREPLRHACETMAHQLRVKTPDLRERIANLSGGNQQKVLIGRWLLTQPRVLILDEPTRGIDVGAKAEVHQLIMRLVSNGVAVLLISSEMPEILGMSDRIMVMHEGYVTGTLQRSEADQARIMDLASH